MQSEGINSQKSKRIATNTVLLFMRMLAIMIVNLYAVRIVLRSLGVEDFGIYNSVAGVVLMSTFLTSTLALSVQRFFSYTIGRGDVERLTSIFSVSFNIIGILSVVILLFFETIGVWFVSTQMTIPPERLTPALWVFQFALFSFLFSLLQVPFTASVFSHEDMGIYALVSLMECLARLMIAFLISTSPIDKLVFYGGGLLLVALGVCSCYAITCLHRYKECRYHFCFQKGIYKELLSFSGWTMLSAISGVGIIQGGTILINVFFGPLANASYSISNQVYNAINALNNSAVLAFRPPMIKAFAEQQHCYLDNLFLSSNKFIIYLLLCVALPLIFCMKTILTLWLGEANHEMVVFSQLFVIYSVCISVHNPITTIVQASGQIRTYTLMVESVTICTLPVTWLTYRLGAPAHMLFICMISLCVLAHIIRLSCLKRVYPLFSYLKYVKTFILPAFLVLLISTAIIGWGCHFATDDILRLCLVSSLSPIVILSLAYFIGITQDERARIRNIIYMITEKL